MGLIKTKEQAAEFLGISENGILHFCKYSNGDWKYKDSNNYYHLFRKLGDEWIELTKGVKAVDVDSYYNGDWGYVTENKYICIFDKENKLIENI